MPGIFRWNLLQEAAFDGVADQQSTDPLSILNGGVNPLLDLVSVMSLIQVAVHHYEQEEF